MLIERTVFQLGAYRITASPKGSVLSSPHLAKSILLTPSQLDYLNSLSQKQTIEQLVLASLKSNTPVKFKELYDLVAELVSNRVALNHQFSAYFEELKEVPTDMQTAPIESDTKSKNWNPQSLLALPFFRTLKKETQDLFVKNCALLEVPERTKLISVGETGRELFVILSGEASIYRVNERNRRELITMIPAGSVFGEGAFLLGQKRTADVITNVPCTLARIAYVKTDFEPLIKVQPPDQLQLRFWILHGLLSSPIFHSVPSETLDLFMYAGQARSVEPNEVLCEEGSEGTNFFVVIQGSVLITKKGKDVKRLKQGDIFGEIAFMVNSGIRTASAIAETKVLLLEMRKEEFLKVLALNLVLAKEIESVAMKRYQTIKAANNL